MSNSGVMTDALMLWLQQIEPPAVLMIVDQQDHIQDFRITNLGELAARWRVATQALAKQDEFSNLRVENSSTEEQKS